MVHQEVGFKLVFKCSSLGQNRPRSSRDVAGMSYTNHLRPKSPESCLWKSSNLVLTESFQDNRLDQWSQRIIRKTIVWRRVVLFLRHPQNNQRWGQACGIWIQPFQPYKVGIINTSSRKPYMFGLSLFKYDWDIEFSLASVGSLLPTPKKMHTTKKLQKMMSHSTSSTPKIHPNSIKPSCMRWWQHWGTRRLIASNKFRVVIRVCGIHISLDTSESLHPGKWTNVHQKSTISKRQFIFRTSVFRGVTRTAPQSGDGKGRRSFETPVLGWAAHFQVQTNTHPQSLQNKKNS